MGPQRAGSNPHTGEHSAGVLCSVWSTAIENNADHFGYGEEGRKSDQRPTGHSPGENLERVKFSVPKEEQSAEE